MLREMKHPLSPEEFREIYSRVTRLCVDLVIRAPEGLVLAERSLPTWSGQWHFPGGTVLYRESIADAATRVAREEAGIDVRTNSLLGYIEYPSEEKERGFGWTITLTLLCDTDATTFTPNDEARAVSAFRELPEKMVMEQRLFLDAHPEWQRAS